MDAHTHFYDAVAHLFQPGAFQQAPVPWPEEHADAQRRPLERLLLGQPEAVGPYQVCLLHSPVRNAVEAGTVKAVGTELPEETANGVAVLGEIQGAVDIGPDPVPRRRPLEEELGNFTISAGRGWSRTRTSASPPPALRE